MTSRSNIVIAVAGLLFLANWLSLALFDIEGGGVPETLWIGYICGSLFGQTTLAAAWAAYGPGRPSFRIPNSLLWVTLLAVAVGINGASQGQDIDGAIVVGTCLFGQWLLLLIVFWGIARVFQVQLQRANEGSGGTETRPWQFGIRHLLVLTATTGAILGVTRLIAGNITELVRSVDPFVSIMLGAVLLTWPLVFATLVRRYAWLGILICLLLISVLTAFEPLFLNAGSLSDHFISVNAFTSAVVVFGTLAMRTNGYFVAPCGPKRVATEP